MPLVNVRERLGRPIQIGWELGTRLASYGDEDLSYLYRSSGEIDDDFPVDQEQGQFASLLNAAYP